LLYDLPDIGEGLRRLIPPDRRDEVVGVAHDVLAAVGSYFRGQLLVAAFVGLATTAGMWAIGLPFWGLVGVIAGVFNLVPAIGAFIAGAVAVVLALTLGDGGGQAVLVVVIVTLVQQVDNHVVTPAVHGRAVDLSPLTIVVAILLGGTLWGLVGALFIIPVLGALKVVALHVMAKTVPWALPEPKEASEVTRGTEGEDAALVAAEPRDVAHVQAPPPSPS
ncbi:MAG: AI-2E family transporter, partial [Actinomycetota bacterium]|nr:AI-2E family transporter [Actinomycetota bacterium]